MKCPKCRGLMVIEKFYHEGGSFWGWRCVHCGEVIDPVIAENRLKAYLYNPVSDYINMEK